MIKNYFVDIPATFFMVLLLTIGCKPTTEKEHHDMGIITIDSALIGVAQASNRQLPAQNIPTVKAELASKIWMKEAQATIDFDPRYQSQVASRVSGRIERLNVNYNYQFVQKGQLLMEIYSPDLIAAQQELLFLIAQDNNSTLISQAKTRLQRLGFDEKLIHQVVQTKKIRYRIPIYSPSNGVVVASNLGTTTDTPTSSITTQQTMQSDGMGSTTTNSVTAPNPKSASTTLQIKVGQYVAAGQTLIRLFHPLKMLASIFVKSNEVTQIAPNSTVLLYNEADKENTLQKVKIAKWEPEMRQGEPFLVARVYLNNSQQKAGAILIAKIPQMIQNAYWLPQASIANLGQDKVVFRKEGNLFKAIPISADVTVNGFVRVKSNISNWVVAKNASYLIDGESFIKYE